MPDFIPTKIVLRLRDEQRRIWEHPDTRADLRLQAHRLMMLLEELAHHRLAACEQAGITIEAESKLLASDSAGQVPR